ncbi:MAG: DNA mismatch repair protein MutS [Candidatus Zixiibacteriota bacterium]|nr:MAG: DNA mismatch repair protein MutS [candidate division Zixibacteria bacterium]
MKTKGGKPDNITPLMRQFHAIKQEHPDKILFFRMGDFYEMFGDDAVRAAPILEIALTSRAHGRSERIPLAGVPYHAADKYLARLLTAGEKVVVVEQAEDPKLAKGLVKREIVEILTPGTATIGDPAAIQSPGCLAAVCGFNGKGLGMAVLDLSTGSFMVDQGDRLEILERIRVAGPAEIVYPADTDRDEVAELLGIESGSERLTGFEQWNFDYRTAERELNQHFETSTLEGFGVHGARLAVTAAGAILRYLKENHRDKLSHINRLSCHDDTEQMTLDYNTVRNLELIQNLSSDSEDHSLFTIVNLCHTPPGARRLQKALLSPYKVKDKIEFRLSGVSELVKSRDLCFSIREETRKLPDLERLAGRLGIGKINPRQVASIKTALQVGRMIGSHLDIGQSPLLRSVAGSLPECRELIRLIDDALVDEPPLTINKGNIFKRGYSDELDRLNDSIREAREYIGSLQQVERERTGISSLKVGFNKVFGYYLEVTKVHAEAVPDHYIRKQTLVNAERYITEELKEKEDLILAAEEKIFSLEERLFGGLLERLDNSIEDILSTADLLAEIDLVSSLAELAVRKGYVKPELFEDNRLVIEGGRHPVIESVLPSGSFVANDAKLGTDQARIVILTGPNMSGKSTYLRQIGLIVILAQIGSFVPADRAEIGLVDRVFTRVGALDNLARGQSTFLVEMVETANILNNATERSLVLLDEVGRGTSTFDGLSVAWSVVEYINEHNNSRTIFATHFHELTGLAGLFKHVRNFQVAVKEFKGKVVFLHKIVEGGCDDSYGIEVARLAGLPRAALTRARQILRLLESGKFAKSELGRQIYNAKVQPTLFETEPSEIERKLGEADLENMTPVEAFDFLRSLREDTD